MIKKVRIEDNIAAYEFNGKPSVESYNQFKTQVESMLNKHKKMKLMIVFKDFKGMDLKTLWEKLKFDFSNRNSFEKMAFVGESKFVHLMSFFYKVFTPAKVKFFDLNNTEIAMKWLEKDFDRKSLSEPVVTPY